MANADDQLAARAQDILAALQDNRPLDDVFTPAFLAAVPPAQLRKIIDSMEAENGRILAVEEVKPLGSGAARFKMRMERAVASASLQLEPTTPFRVAGFRISAVTPLDEGPQRILSDFQALPGQSGFALVRLGDAGIQPVLTSHADQQFAIGSTFKLWVLDTLAEEIAQGRLRWDQVVRLGQRSFPTGQMQDWPDQAPVTVETLATMMMSISDNTATDTLIRLIGRNRIGAHMRALRHGDPARSLPLLTTREAFALKAGSAGARAAYATADDAAQLRQLEALERGFSERPDTRDIFFGEKPVAIDSIEWFASPNDSARAMDSLRRRSDPRVLAILGVKPGLTGELASRFRRIGYKGGSEPGVVNLSWILQSRKGEWYVATASWNNPAQPVDDHRLEALAQRLIAMIP